MVMLAVTELNMVWKSLLIKITRNSCYHNWRRLKCLIEDFETMLKNFAMSAALLLYSVKFGKIKLYIFKSNNDGA